MFICNFYLLSEKLQRQGHDRKDINFEESKLLTAGVDTFDTVQVSSKEVGSHSESSSGFNVFC